MIDDAINNGRTLHEDFGRMLVNDIMPFIGTLAYWIALIYGAYNLMCFFATRNKKYSQRTAVCVVAYTVIAAIGKVMLG